MDFRSRIVGSFSGLFGERDEEDEQNDWSEQAQFGKQWGWYQSIYAAAKGNILEFDRVTKQPVSVAVMAYNPFEKSCCSSTPWIIWNLPPVPEIPAGIPRQGTVTEPITAIQGITDHGILGYTGPCPLHGAMIRYQFKVYGLDRMLDLGPGSDKHALVSAMKGHVLQFGETVAICSR